MAIERAAASWGKRFASRKYRGGIDQHRNSGIPTAGSTLSGGRDTADQRDVAGRPRPAQVTALAADSELRRAERRSAFRWRGLVRDAAVELSRASFVSPSAFITRDCMRTDAPFRVALRKPS